MINIPGEPAAGIFPFAYPLFLTPLIRAFPENIDALKIPSLLATISIATVLFWGWGWLSKSKSYWWALAITGLYAHS
jgi:hypothetical protein